MPLAGRSAVQTDGEPPSSSRFPCLPACQVRVTVGENARYWRGDAAAADNQQALTSSYTSGRASIRVIRRQLLL